MQFKVPQFIDIEDTLFGPLTFKQFVYLAGGAGGAFVLYKILPIWISIFLVIPIIILSLLLAFYKVNNKPFIYYLQAGIGYLTSSKLYLWKQRLVKDEDQKDQKDDIEIHKNSPIPMVSENKLRDLSWSLDIEEEEKNKQSQVK